MKDRPVQADTSNIAVIAENDNLKQTDANHEKRRWEARILVLILVFVRNLKFKIGTYLLFLFFFAEESELE